MEILNDEQLGRDRGFMNVVLAEEATPSVVSFCPDKYGNVTHKRPEIPKAVAEEIEDIDNRSRNRAANGPAAAELRGNIEALRLYGRLATAEAIQE